MTLYLIELVDKKKSYKYRHNEIEQSNFYLIDKPILVMFG